MRNLDMHSSSGGSDEALWNAYRRHDKAAVMDYLFRRSLVGTGPSRSFPQLAIKSSSKRGRDARSGHRGPRLIDEGAHQIPLGSALN
jgi:hypothetical protein